MGCWLAIADVLHGSGGRLVPAAAATKLVLQTIAAAIVVVVIIHSRHRCR
jgi:hypothetical protein